MRQALRMRYLADGVVMAGKIAVADFVCPTEQARLEFDPDFIAEHSAPEQQIYREQTLSREPMASVLANNPEICFVPPQRKSEWGKWQF